MRVHQAIGVRALVVGLVLIVVGVNAPQTLLERWENLFSAEFIDHMAWLLLAAVPLTVLGLMFSLNEGRKAFSPAPPRPARRWGLVDTSSPIAPARYRRHSTRSASEVPEWNRVQRDPRVASDQQCGACPRGPARTADAHAAT